LQDTPHDIREEVHFKWLRQYVISTGSAGRLQYIPWPRSCTARHRDNLNLGPLFLKCRYDLNSLLARHDEIRNDDVWRKTSEGAYSLLAIADRPYVVASHRENILDCQTHTFIVVND